VISVENWFQWLGGLRKVWTLLSIDLPSLLQLSFSGGGLTHSGIHEEKNGLQHKTLAVMLHQAGSFLEQKAELDFSDR